MNLRRALWDQRGATLLEYVLLGVVVFVLAAMGLKALGDRTGQSSDEANRAFGGQPSERTGHGSGVASKSSIASKVTVDANTGGHSKSWSSRMTDTTTGDLDFSWKKLARWFAIVLVALGVGVGFSVFKRARAEVATTASVAVNDDDPDRTSPRRVVPPGILPGNAGPSTRAPTKYTD